MVFNSSCTQQGAKKNVPNKALIKNWKKPIKFQFIYRRPSRDVPHLVPPSDPLTATSD